MVKIEKWFPVPIGIVFNTFHKEIEDDLSQVCLETKKFYKEQFDDYVKENNASSSPLLDWYQFQKREAHYRLLEDPKFSRLNDWIDDQISLYTEQLEFNTPKLKCNEGWFNVMEKYEFTDYHNHAPNAISCVYFLACTEPDSGAKLLIKNRNSNDYSSYSKLFPSYMVYNPDPGKLVIFSSTLEHAVQQHNTDDLRITLAYNYNINY